MSYNNTLQGTFDPPPTFAFAKAHVASNAPERGRYVPMSNSVKRPELQLHWFYSVDEGRQLELEVQTAQSKTVLFSVVADDADESLWCEFFVNGEVVQVPVAAIQNAFNMAREEVHSETWFERNVHSEPNGT